MERITLVTDLFNHPPKPMTEQELERARDLGTAIKAGCNVDLIFDWKRSRLITRTRLPVSLLKDSKGNVLSLIEA